MGENGGSSFPQQPFNLQSSYLNSWRTPIHLPQQTTTPSFMNPDMHMASSNSKRPESLFPQRSDSPHGHGHAMEPHAWFYCLPSFRQDFMPAKSVLKEKLSSIASDNCCEATTSKAGSAWGQKKLLVVDKSGDQTTLIFSSGIGTPVQYLTPSTLKPSVVCNLTEEDPGAKKFPNFHSAPIWTDEVGENKVMNTNSEMHEDTEELNALLYSDDDSDYEDEVTSTGHAPSTMTLHDKQYWFDSSAEEVASSMAVQKKRRLFDGGDNNVAILPDTADSVKAKKCRSEYDDDAHSSCANVWNSGSSEESFSTVNKRMGKEKLTEIVDVLQNVVPGLKGKDAIMVLDEAIQYLETLKRKATALGLDTI